MQRIAEMFFVYFYTWSSFYTKKYAMQKHPAHAYFFTSLCPTSTSSATINQNKQQHNLDMGERAGVTALEQKLDAAGT